MKQQRSGIVFGIAGTMLICGLAPALASINAGDHLNVHVYNHPELSTAATVDSRGEIQLPVVGTVHVQGLQSSAVAFAIQERIKPFVPFPAVDVQDTNESQIIFVSGGPGGVLPYAPNETLSAAVSEISKVSPYTVNAQTPPNAPIDRLDHSRIDLKHIGIVRGGKSIGHYDLLALRATGDSGPQLYANDTVSFANKPISVEVVGAVNTPGTAYLWPDEPLSDAIAQCGGTSSVAAAGHIVLSHVSESNQTVSLGDSVFNQPAEAGELITIPTAPRVTVAGLVERPGVVSLQSDFTLLSALAASGGYNKFGDLRQVQLVHQGVRTQYNIVALAHGDMAQNPVLHDGDTVFVPEGYKTDWSQVFNAIGGLSGLANIGIFLAPHR